MAIVLAMYFHNPGVTSYEMYGALFDLTGTIWQFALLGIVLITALFINRPWCKYLCPIPPVLDLYCNFREWGIESWRRLEKRTAG
jgi:polyferredoxin